MSHLSTAVSNKEKYDWVYNLILTKNDIIKKI